jgi:hypothetical protein
MARSVWRCTRCGEEVPGQFDSCWRCGANLEGTPADDFVPEPEDSAVPDLGPEPEGAKKDAAVSGEEGSTGEDGLSRIAIAELACRLMALWLFAQVALGLTPLLVLLPGLLFERGLDASLGVAFAGALLPLGSLIFGVFLWRGSHAVARRLVHGNPSPLVTRRFSRQDLMAVGFAVIGMYAVWASAERMLHAAVRAIYMAHQLRIEVAKFLNNADWMADFLGNLAGLAFGLCLLLGSSGIARLARRMGRR